MRTAIALATGLMLAGAIPKGADAATFTPDMWVYEVTLTATELIAIRGSAFATADVIDRLPAGCRAAVFTVSELAVICTGIPEEIDTLATIDPSFASFVSRTARIGFNATQAVCDWSLIGFCPADLRNSEGIPTWIREFYSGVTVDAALGELSYCALVVGGLEACYSFSPTRGVSVGAPFFGAVFVESGASGVWNFGNGGT